MSEQSKHVLYRVDGGTAHLTLNRPEKRNALNDLLISALKDALSHAADDKTIRVVVIAGAGNDFCAGADLSALKQIATASVKENQDDARSVMDLFRLLRAVPLPVIAAVKGRAIAGGCGLASACDLVLASENARFGYPEVKLGFVPAMVSAMLRRNISEKRAFELLTRGDEIDAFEARSLGLVNQVFPNEEFEGRLEVYARSFEKLSSSAIALTKDLLYQIDGMTFPDALQTGADVNVIARLTEDCQAGIAKFIEKAQ